MSEQEIKDNPQGLGLFLRNLRAAKNFTLRFVEENTGVSNAYLSQLENDKIKKPSANILHKLAEFYKADFNQLLTLSGILDAESPVSVSVNEYVFSKDNLTEDEEEELIKYLKFIRLRNENKI
jgi:transcriptional regulator with XRE-family HTH domain